MSIIPNQIVGEVDQRKAEADDVVSGMILALREEIAGGADPTDIWFKLVGNFWHDERITRYRLSAVAATAMVKLARSAPRPAA